MSSRVLHLIFDNMAPPKKPMSQLSDSAKWYRKNAAGRKKKAKTDKKVNARADQRAKRSELTTRNRAYDEKHGKSKRKGKDYDHATKKYVKSSVNRGRKNEGNR